MPTRKLPTKAPLPSDQGEPHIGIFWVFAGKLLKAGVLLKDGLEAPAAING